MVKNNEPKIIEGRNFLVKLDNTKFKPKAFFWLYLPDIDDWRLILTSNFLNNKAPQESYKELIEFFKNDSDFKAIEPSNITIIHTEDKLIKLLRGALRTKGNSIDSIRFRANTINNLYIEDAIIYRIT